MSIAAEIDVRSTTVNQALTLDNQTGVGDSQACWPSWHSSSLSRVLGHRFCSHRSELQQHPDQHSTFNANAAQSPYHPRTSNLRLSNLNSSSSWLTIGPQARGFLLPDMGPSSCRIQYSSSYLTSTSTVFSPQTWTPLPIQQFREENIFITARLNCYRRLSVYDLLRARFEQLLCLRIDVDVDRRSLVLEETQRPTERFAVELNIQCLIIDATCRRHRAFASTFAA